MLGLGNSDPGPLRPPFADELDDVAARRNEGRSCGTDPTRFAEDGQEVENYR